jgi:hypothetical protein
MKKPVKLALLAGTILVGLLFLGALLVPVIFEDRIVERLRTELNEELDATVRFSAIDVSLLSTFPTRVKPRAPMRSSPSRSSDTGYRRVDQRTRESRRRASSRATSRSSRG